MEPNRRDSEFHAFENSSLQNAALTNTRPRYEYLSIRETASLFRKGVSRTYAMAAEGLFNQVGLRVVRFSTPKKKGRIWIGIPDDGRLRLSLSRLKPFQQEGDP